MILNVSDWLTDWLLSLMLLSRFFILIANPDWRCPKCVQCVQCVQCAQCVQRVQCVQCVLCVQCVQCVQCVHSIYMLYNLDYRVPKWNVFMNWFNVDIKYSFDLFCWCKTTGFYLLTRHLQKDSILYVLHHVLQYFNVYSMYIQYIFNIHSMYIQCFPI